MHEHAEVTGDELATVTESVQAYDSAVTVESVDKDPDGSYDVHATNDGQPVMLEVSADLATITERAGGPGRGGGPGQAGQGPGQGAPGGELGQPHAADGESSSSTDATAGSATATT